MTKPINKYRSERAARAVKFYGSRNQCLEENIIDLLTDLIHLCDESGLNFEKLIRFAYVHDAVES